MLGSLNADFRYAQFCPLARAAELLGERWTLLVIRELLVGPQRFSDLRRRLPGLSASVLAQRLERLERRQLVCQRLLPPPAASRVYELDEAGRALLPAVVELARWGTRFLLPAVADDHFEPDWLQMAMLAFAARRPGPARTYEVVFAVGEQSFVTTLRGGGGGTEVIAGASPEPPDARIRGTPPALLGLAAGVLTAAEVLRSGEVSVEGDPEALAQLPQLFDFVSPLRAPGSPAEPIQPTQ